MLQQITLNSSVLQRFAALLQRNRLAHAYLFAGPQSAGKSETAVSVAKMVNCDARSESEPFFCDMCASCRKIGSGNHPDVMVIEADESRTIKIAQVRDMIARSQLRPFEAEKKVFIVKDIENLSLEGSNALLKTLEEPARDSLLILTSAVPERSLGTVRSRCHMMHFFPVPSAALARTLTQASQWDEETAHVLAFFSEGCAGKAKELADRDFLVLKNGIIDNMAFLENNEAYLKPVLEDKDRTAEMLDVLVSWFRDAVFVKQGVGAERITHIDRIRDLGRVKQQYTFDQLFAIIDEIVNTKRLLNENLNVKIAVQLLREKIWMRS